MHETDRRLHPKPENTCIFEKKSVILLKIAFYFSKFNLCF